MKGDSITVEEFQKLNDNLGDAFVPTNRYQNTEMAKKIIADFQWKLDKAINSIQAAVNYMEASGYGSYPDEEPECQMFEDLKKTLKEIK